MRARSPSNSSSAAVSQGRLLISDVFKSSAVKRAFLEDVIKIVSKIALEHRKFYEGNMVSSSEGDEWILGGGKVTRTPAFWGRPSHLIVEGEEAQVAILKLLNKPPAKRGNKNSKAKTRYRLIGAALSGEKSFVSVRSSAMSRLPKIPMLLSDARRLWVVAGDQPCFLGEEKWLDPDANSK
jgi:hypothetical protein